MMSPAGAALRAAEAPKGVMLDMIEALSEAFEWAFDDGAIKRPTRHT